MKLLGHRARIWAVTGGCCNDLLNLMQVCYGDRHLLGYQLHVDGSIGHWLLAQNLWAGDVAELDEIDAVAGEAIADPLQLNLGICPPGLQITALPALTANQNIA